jgi:hypothetical protein
MARVVVWSPAERVPISLKWDPRTSDGPLGTRAKPGRSLFLAGTFLLIINPAAVGLNKILGRSDCATQHHALLITKHPVSNLRFLLPAARPAADVDERNLRGNVSVDAARVALCAASCSYLALSECSVSFWTRQLFMSATSRVFSDGQAMPWIQLNWPASCPDSPNVPRIWPSRDNL